MISTVRRPAGSFNLLCGCRIHPRTLNNDIDRVWPAAQLSLVELLPNTPQIIAHGSIHYIQVTEPDLAVAATRLAVARIASAD